LRAKPKKGFPSRSRATAYPNMPTEARQGGGEREDVFQYNRSSSKVRTAQGFARNDSIPKRNALGVNPEPQDFSSQPPISSCRVKISSLEVLACVCVCV
jgi:hypothetical protein